MKNRTIGTSERAAATVTAAASDAVDRLHSAGESAVDRLHQAGESAVDRIHSASESAVASAAGVLHDAGELLQQAPRKVAQATQGSPIGVGLIAFGAGMLAAALVPETEAERRAAQQVAEYAGPALAPLQPVGQALASDVRDTVAAAGEEVRAAAVEGGPTSRPRRGRAPTRSGRRPRPARPSCDRRPATRRTRRPIGLRPSPNRFAATCETPRD